MPYLFTSCFHYYVVSIHIDPSPVGADEGLTITDCAVEYEEYANNTQLVPSYTYNEGAESPPAHNESVDTTALL
jgi:hypothetical protein